MHWTSKPCTAALGALAGLFVLTAPAADTTNAEADALLLRNGDAMEGHLVSIEQNHIVRWKHADVAEPIEFKLDSLSQLDLRPPAPPERGTNDPCKVYLNQGDVLEGDVVSCSQETLILETWYAGQLKIPRKFIQSIYFYPTTPDLFVMTGKEGWTQGEASGVLGADSDQWIFRDGAFYAGKSASIARNIKLPDAADLQFDLAWTGNLSLSLAMYTDSLQPILIASKDTAPDFGAFYSIRFQPGYVDVARIKKKEAVTSLAPVVVPAFSLTNRAHIDLRARKKSNTLALAVDGQWLAVWNDTNGFAGQGSAVRFVHNFPGQVKISNLRVSPWDGVWEADPTNAPAANQDVAWLTNATTQFGVIESLADGKLILRGKRDKVEIPLGKVRRLAFASPSNEPAKELEGSVHADFAHGGPVTFQLESWTASGVKLRSPVFGQAVFNTNAFRRLVFRPPDAAGGDAPGNGGTLLR